MQNPLCAFHTFTVVSEEADITKRGKELTNHLVVELITILKTYCKIM